MRKPKVGSKKVGKCWRQQDVKQGGHLAHTHFAFHTTHTYHTLLIPTKRPYLSYRPHTHQPTTHLSYVSQTYMYKNSIKTRYQSLYSQTNILILSTVLEELRQLKMQESEIMGVGRGQLLRFTQIAQSHFATALRMQSLYTYKCGQFYLKMHKIHICKHGILSVWIILIKSLNSIIYEEKTKLYEIDTCRGV